MAEDLPYKAEYAKSGRSSCKGCRTPIPQGKLRIARMVQSAFFDGKQCNWYHDNCFFMKQRPKNVAEIGNFRALRNDDQKRIKEEIESSGSGIVMPEAKPKKSKGTKRSKTDDKPMTNGALKDFGVEYSKSSRATCVVCEIKIIKGEVRICKKVYDTEIGQKFGGQPLWHHVKCFAENRSNLLYFAGGELLPGFNSLTKEDKDMVKKAVPSLKQDEVPVKKLKEEPMNKEEKAASEKEEKEIQDQTKLFFRFRDSLKKNLGKGDYANLLEYNSQEVPSGEDRMLDRLADAMAFGALKPCKVCKEGQLVLGTYGYTCTGDLTEWTKCQNSTKNPERVPFTFPAHYKEVPTFSRYKFKPRTRIFEDLAPPVLIKSESELLKIKSNKPIPPLKNLQFFIYGLSKNKKEEIKNRILKLGGNVASKLHENIAAVVASEKDIVNMNDKMTEVQGMDIQVVESSFLDDIKENGTIAQSIDLIKEKNIAPWGSDPVKRIPQDVIDGKSIPKSSSMYKSKSASGKTKLKLKDGTAVDPDSGLDDVAHVYIDRDGEKYSVVLGLTDIVSKKNSFYKLQILESNNKTKFWLFRSWGRIGTTIGGNKTENCSSLSDAKQKFSDLYFDKTDNMWMDRHDFMKMPGKMYPIDIDYGEDKPLVKLDNKDGSSKLPQPVQHLVQMIFDVNIMKKVMLEFELDTEKMPLGKLSRKQLTSGYKVLTELQKILTNEKKKSNPANQGKIIDATNRFYTLIPHDFGIENPPLLDDEEVIKIKTSMLDNLLEIEIAYNMLTDESDSTGSPLDTHYIQLKSEISPVITGSPEYEIAMKYVKNTHADTHKQYELEIFNLFKVNREGEDKRFKPFRKISHRRLLWHGSRVTNFAGILSQGLRIAPPEAPVTGYMFGKGIYFADMVSKSANYCCTNPTDNVGVLLLCEVALGEMHELTQANYVTKLPPGKHSVKGVGRTEPDPSEDIKLDCGTIVPLGKPITKKIQTSLLYNEYIVYDVAQVNVKYLFQMKFNYKY